MDEERAGRSLNSQIGYDTLVHRFYGAITIEDVLFRVKSTILETRGQSKTEPHDYKVAKVDVILNGGSPTSYAPRTSTIAVAKLLNNIEKSYDFGKKVLEESKKNENLSEYSRFILNIDDIISKKGVVVEPVADYDNADLGGAGLQYRIIADNKVIGFIPLEAYYDFKTKQPDFLDKKVSVVNFGNTVWSI